MEAPHGTMGLMLVNVNHGGNKLHATDLPDACDDPLVESHSPSVISFSGAVTSLWEQHDGVYTHLINSGNLVDGHILRSTTTQISD